MINASLTFVLVVGSDGQNGVLDVLVLVDLRLVQVFVEERRVVVLVGDPDADELCHCDERVKIQSSHWLRLSYASLRTRVGLSAGIGPGRRRSVACLDLQGVGALALPIEDDPCTDLASLAVDLEVVLALRVFLDVVINLAGGETCINDNLPVRAHVQ